MNKLFTILLVFISAHVFCQVGGMSISPNGIQPDPSAMLDISSTTKGTLITRMTTAQRNAIASPAKGLQIFNTDCNVINYNAGTPGSPIWATIAASNVLAAGVTIAANPIGAICAGSSVTFTATPSNGINSPSYQWKVNGNNVGTNSTTYSASNLNNGDVVTCVLTTSEDCVTGSPATSNPITLLVNIVPAITGTTPSGFCTGNAVTLGASANIGTINWYANATGGSSLSSGASFTVAGLNQSTTYYVDATANGCTTATRTAVLATFYPNVPVQPGLITGPELVRRNDTATYTVSPVPNTATYGWSVSSGVIIGGQGTNTVTVVWGDTSIVTIAVTASSPCGTGPGRSKYVYIGYAPFYATGTLRNGIIQSFTVPAGFTSITVDAFGAQGGSGNGGYGAAAYGCNCSSPGGKGAEIKGTVAVNGGDVINILVGQAGGGYGGPHGNENGGGGGTFVVDSTTNTLLVAAGGGGGGPSTNNGTSCSRNSPDGDGQAGNNGATPTCPQCGCNGGSGGSGGNGGTASGNNEGAGGGGYTGNGGNGGAHCSTAIGGLSYTNGGTGGLGNTCYDGSGTNNAGGFGGGGGGMLGGPGGGGGYSGGGEIGSWSTYSTWGGGGGSYNSGINQTNTGGVQIGHGQVFITW